jgi:hypothetical protein
MTRPPEQFGPESLGAQVAITECTKRIAVLPL